MKSFLFAGYFPLVELRQPFSSLFRGANQILFNPEPTATASIEAGPFAWTPSPSAPGETIQALSSKKKIF